MTEHETFATIEPTDGIRELTVDEMELVSGGRPHPIRDAVVAVVDFVAGIVTIVAGVLDIQHHGP